MTQSRIEAVVTGVPTPTLGKAEPHGWMFDAFRLDLRDERLWRGQEVIHLHPKTFAVLRCLVSQASQLVTKEALLETVWPETAVSESVLQVAIRELRRAVGDSGRTQQVIQTVHGRGYRFIAAVEEKLSEAEPLSASPSAPVISSGAWLAGSDFREAERRQLTVLVCRLVDRPERTTPLDPETLLEVLPAYRTLCAEVVHRFGGHIAQDQGDGMVVYFGYPQAHEDDACRAVYTGLGILEAMRPLQARRVHDEAERFAVRVGVHTGLVVISGLGQHNARGPLALGQTPTIAAQVQGLAPPDTVAISSATQRLVEGYVVTQALGTYPLDGAPAPLGVFQVLQHRPVPNRFAVTAAQGLTPFVGREVELALLRQRWAQVQDGRGQMIVLRGEPGIGKSRLVQVLKDQVADEPHVRWECRSAPYYQNTALYPMTDLLQRALQWHRNDTPEQRVAKLEQVLSQYPLPLTETIPLFAPLLSLPIPTDTYPPLNLSPQRQRQKTLESLVAILLELAAREPVLFILEDLQWTDPTTLEFLGLLVEQVPASAICMLLTCRPEFQSSWHYRSYLTEITVDRLSEGQIAQMAQHVAGDKALPGDIIPQLVDKTDGVPLYVEEMTKALLESGYLKDIEGRYELTGTGPALAIPATLHDSLMARLDRLVTAKGIAQLGATIGRQFSYALLQAVAQLDDAILQRELARLAEAELLYQHGLPPQTTYTFKHALIQDVAYQSLLKSTRQQYHQQIAQVLEERFAETVATQPEFLAHHYTEAGLYRQAIGYWQRAGHQASQRSAHVEAISHFTTGIALLKSLPETPERALQELTLQRTLGVSLLAIKGFGASEVESAYRRARELCYQVGDTSDIFPVLFGLLGYYSLRSEWRTARGLAEELLALAERHQDSGYLLMAHRALGSAFFWTGELVTARSHLEQGMALYDKDRHRNYAYIYGQDPLLGCQAYATWALWILGYPDQALKLSEAALTWAQQLAHPFSMTFPLTWSVIVYRLRGEWQAALDRAQTLAALATEQGFQQLIGEATRLQGMLQAMLGNQAGITQMLQGGAIRARTGARMRNSHRVLNAEAYRIINQPEEGLRVINEASLVSKETGECVFESELYRVKGELLITLSGNNQTEAEQCFHKALEIAASQQAKSWELKSATSLARLWQSQDRRQEAYDLLAPVYGWFTEGFDTADLREAKALLEALA